MVLAALGVLAPLASFRRARWSADATRYLVTYTLVVALAYWLSLGPRGGAYGWLMSVVPGFDGLRVPARFIVVVSLALALLGAAGAGWLCRGITRRGASVALVMSLCTLILAEGYGPLHVETFRAGQRQRAALHAWLATEPPGAVLELPIAGPDLASFTLSYQYATLLHGRPIVNGYSGWGSPIQDFLADPDGPFSRPSEMDALLEGLSALGVRHVVLHRSEYSRQTLGSYSDPQPLADALEQSEWTDTGRAFVPIHAWPLKAVASDASGAPSGAQSLNAATDFAVTASGDTGLAKLTDGDAQSTWATTQTGDEWINVTFPQMVDVAHVEIGLRASRVRNYPSRLRIDSTNEAGISSVLVERAALPLVLAGMARSPQAPAIALSLAANRSTGIRIRQTGVGNWPWEVSELRVWRR